LAPIKAIHRLVYKANRGRGSVAVNKWWKINPEMRKDIQKEELKRAAQEAVWEHIRRTPMKVLKKYHSGNEAAQKTLGIELHNTAKWAVKNYAMELRGQRGGYTRYAASKAIKEGNFKEFKETGQIENVAGRAETGAKDPLRALITDPNMKRMSEMGFDPEDIMEGEERKGTKADTGVVSLSSDERLRKEVKMTMPKAGSEADLGRKPMSKRTRKATRRRMFKRKMTAMKEGKLSDVTAEEHKLLQEIEKEKEIKRKRDEAEAVEEFGKGQDVVPHKKTEAEQVAAGSLNIDMPTKSKPKKAKKPLLTRKQKIKLKQEQEKAKEDAKAAAKEANIPVSQFIELANMAQAQKDKAVDNLMKRNDKEAIKIGKEIVKLEAALLKKKKNPHYNPKAKYANKMINKVMALRDKREKLEKMNKTRGMLEDAVTEMKYDMMMADNLKKANGSTIGTQFYSGIPIMEMKRLAIDPLANAWTKTADRMGVKIKDWTRKQTNKSDFLTWLADKTIEDFGLDNTYKELRREFSLQRHRWENIAADHASAINNINGVFEHAAKKYDISGKEIKNRMAKLVSHGGAQLRAKQIAGGSITSYNDKFKAVLAASERFKRLEKMLTKRGLLGKHQFQRLTRREISKAMDELADIRGEHEVLMTELVELYQNTPEDKKTEKSLLKKLQEKEEDRAELTARVQIHYKNSGKTYFRMLYDKVKSQDSAIRKYNDMKMNQKWNIKRANWNVSVDKDTGVVKVSQRGAPMKSKSQKTLAQQVHKGISDEARDAFLYDLYTQIVDRDAKVAKARGLEKLPKEERWIGEAGEKGYSLVPNEKAPHSGKPLWGALAGQWVQNAMHRELMNVQKEVSKAENMLLKAIRMWKAGKTVWSPRTHVRNILSNMVLADIIGDVPLVKSLTTLPFNWRRIVKLKFMTKEDIKDPVERAFKYDTTLTRHTFVQSEISTHKRTNIAQKFQDRQEKKFKKANPKEAYVPSEKMAKAVNYNAMFNEKFMEKPGTYYQYAEESMKFVVFKDNIKRQMNDLGFKPKDLNDPAKITKDIRKKIIEEAEAKANASLFDYSKVPPAIAWARNGYSPFVTFMYKAIPGLAKSFARKPWKLMKYYGMYYVIQKWMDNASGEDDEQLEMERRNLPHFMQRWMMPWQPSHIRLPFKDVDGRSVYFDLSFIVPWGELSEGVGDLNLGWKVIMPQNPLWNTFFDIVSNENIFLQQDLTLKHDTWTERTGKIISHMVKSAAPGWAEAGVRTVKKLGIEPADYRGRDNDPMVVLADTILGLKFRKQDHLANVIRRHRELGEEASSAKLEFIQRMNGTIFKRKLTGEAGREARTGIINDYIDDITRVQDKSMYLMNVEDHNK